MDTLKKCGGEGVNFQTVITKLSSPKTYFGNKIVSNTFTWYIHDGLTLSYYISCLLYWLYSIWICFQKCGGEGVKLPTVKMQIAKFCFVHISASGHLVFKILSLLPIITYKLLGIVTRISKIRCSGSEQHCAIYIFAAPQFKLS